jgi:hypothetical protein
VSFAGRWNEHPQWGVHWHVADLDAALGLLGLPAARVQDILDQHWEDLVEPSTPTHSLLALAGLPRGAQSSATVSTCPPLGDA